MRSSIFSRKKISLMIGIAAALGMGLGFTLFNKENKTGTLFCAVRVRYTVRNKQ